MTTATDLPPMPAGVGKMTIAKSFELDARAITAFAAGVDDFNPVYLDDAREGGLIAHPGMVFSWQWNSRHVPDETLPLELVRRSVHAWIDVRFDRHPREGDIITCQGKQVAVRQVRSGVLSSQRFTFRDSSGAEIAVMDTGGVTRGAALDGEDQILVEPPDLPQRSDPAAEPVWYFTFNAAPTHRSPSVLPLNRPPPPQSDPRRTPPPPSRQKPARPESRLTRCAARCSLTQ